MHLPPHRSFDRSGYEREAAVRELARQWDGDELPYLLLRLNDWVPQVREAAWQAVIARLTPEYAEHFARNLAFLARLSDARRADHQPLLAAIARLTAAHARQRLIDSLRSESVTSRRTAFRLLTDGGGDELDDVLRAASEAGDFLLRLYAVRLLPAERLRDLLSDSAASVRREALRRWIAAFPNDAVAALRNALMDRSASIRDEARFELRSRSDDDPSRRYRESLTNNAIAIDGLGETGTAADADLLLPYLEHESARIRRAAVRAIARLKGDGSVPLLGPMILDRSPAVSAQARRALIRHAQVLDVADLDALWRNATAPHMRRNVIRLFGALPKWESIIALLDVAGDDNDAMELVHRWFAAYNRSQIAPTADQLARLQRAMTLSPLDDRRRLELRFTLSAFR